ncbi:MAG: lipopolysaccharide biosynthesis protein [Thermodesulfobacteriota bacterium]
MKRILAFRPKSFTPGPTLIEKESRPEGFTRSLGARTFTGTLWILGERFYRQIIFLLNAAILGRLLGPHDFGLVGYGTLAIHLLGVFTYTGFAEALVQRSSLGVRTIQTGWWVMVGRAAVIALILFFIAPVVALRVQEPEVTRVLQALAGVYLLTACSSIGTTLLYKEMRFQKIFQIEASAITLDLMTAIVAALIWRNVWALVLGAGVGALTRVALSYIIYPIRPRLIFDLNEAWKLFQFGQWLLYGGALYFMETKGTEMLSGFLYGATGLGLYQIASRFALLPSTHVGETFFQALFPTYSHLQDEPEKLRGAFLRVLQVATFIIFPLSALMAVVAGPIIPLIMGPQWQGVVNLVPGLALGGALLALIRTAPPLLMATGKPKYQFFLDLNCAAGLLVSIYPLYRLGGLSGLPWAYALGFFSGLPLWWRLVRRQSQAGSRDLLISLGPAVLASLLLVISIEGFMSIFHLQLMNWRALAWVLPLGAGSLVLYLCTILAMERLLPGYQPVQNSWRLIKGVVQ